MSSASCSSASASFATRCLPRVGQYAVRILAFRTFVHLHELSLRFHLERRTGGLSRVIERGVKGIETIVRFTMLATAPTILEFALTAGIFAFAYGWLYVVVDRRHRLALHLVHGAGEQLAHFDPPRDERVRHRGQHQGDRLAAQLRDRQIFQQRGHGGRALRPLDGPLRGRRHQTWTSLGWLNFGQGVIFGLGMTIVMWLSAREVIAGTQTVGDFVFVNAMLMQLSQPLNFIGMIYREIRQGLTDIEQMFDLLDVKQEIIDRPGATPLVVGAGKVEFRDVHFSYDPARQILKGVSFTVRPAGRWRSSARRAPASRRSRDCCSASTTSRAARS